jgi:hypothetical protein
MHIACVHIYSVSLSIFEIIFSMDMEVNIQVYNEIQSVFLTVMNDT